MLSDEYPSHIPYEIFPYTSKYAIIFAYILNK